MHRLFVLLAIVSLSLGGMSARSEDGPAAVAVDNRLPKPFPMVSGLGGHPVFTTVGREDFYPRDEAGTCKAIMDAGDDKLVKALGWTQLTQPLYLKWNRKVSLKDADYVLCLFDAGGRSNFGPAPRVLVLFTLEYKIKTWGEFGCSSPFDYGAIINNLGLPDTYLVTVNPSGRFGGELSFEKYKISSAGIEKLGESMELTKIKYFPEQIIQGE